MEISPMCALILHNYAQSGPDLNMLVQYNYEIHSAQYTGYIYYNEVHIYTY